MPNWRDLLDEVNAAGSGHDQVRRKYLALLSRHTKRNTILYYSGWLQKSDEQRSSTPTGFAVNDDDKNAFMATIHQLDRRRGLDLILHTPGGDIAATESLVDYLRSMFGTDIRTIVPQLALSAGTMMALAGRSIIMGKHSSLGPIDPQTGGVAAHGIVEEFRRAEKDIAKNNLMIALWQPIIAKYSPTLLGECEKAIEWGNEIVKGWLETGMFADDPEATALATKAVELLGDHAQTKSHARHISISKAREIGLRVEELESDSRLQELVLSVHHACIQTLASTPAVKIVENQKGVAYITSMQQLAVLRSQ